MLASGRRARLSYRFELSRGEKDKPRSRGRVELGFEAAGSSIPMLVGGLRLDQRAESGDGGKEPGWDVVTECVAARAGAGGVEWRREVWHRGKGTLDVASGSAV